MAIVVEEQKNRGTLIAVVTWAAGIIVVGVGAYYLFFKAPTLVEIALPADFESIKDISQITLDPGEVLGSTELQALQPYITLVVPSTAGRPNPFLGF